LHITQLYTDYGTGDAGYLQFTDILKEQKTWADHTEFHTENLSSGSKVTAKNVKHFRHGYTCIYTFTAPNKPWWQNKNNHGWIECLKSGLALSQNEWLHTFGTSRYSSKPTASTHNIGWGICKDVNTVLAIRTRIVFGPLRDGSTEFLKYITVYRWCRLILRPNMNNCSQETARLSPLKITTRLVGEGRQHHTRDW
jgi:hypothetical protein